MCTLTCDDVLGGRRSALVVLHHLQLDLVLLAGAQARLLKGGLRSAEGVKNLTVLLFLPVPKKHQSSTTTKTKSWHNAWSGRKKKNCQIIHNGALGGVWT